MASGWELALAASVLTGTWVGGRRQRAREGVGRGGETDAPAPWREHGPADASNSVLTAGRGLWPPNRKNVVLFPATFVGVGYGRTADACTGVQTGPLPLAGGVTGASACAPCACVCVCVSALTSAGQVTCQPLGSKSSLTQHQIQPHTAPNPTSPNTGSNNTQLENQNHSAPNSTSHNNKSNPTQHQV